MRKLEESVLKTYTVSSPSYTSADTDDEWNALVHRRARILHRLHLLPEIFNGKKLLDLGCGTGEHSCFYASLGSHITGVDFNPVSLTRLKELFEARGFEDKLDNVVEIPVSEWSPSQEEFDICISSGVLHHLSDPYEGFSKLCSALKPNGIMIISTGVPNGSYQRELMKQIILKFTSNLDDAIKLALDLFPEYMDRAVSFGHRTIEQVVSDNFITEQDVRIPVSDLLTWFHEGNLSLYDTYPKLVPAFCESATSPIVDWTDKPYRNYLDSRSKSWKYARDSVSEIVQSQRGGAEIRHLETLGENEGTKVENFLETGDLAALRRLLPTCKVFGRGYCGVGESFYVGVKNPPRKK